jgi:hypothetical protein
VVGADHISSDKYAPGPGNGTEWFIRVGFECPELCVMDAFLPAETYLDEANAVEFAGVWDSLGKEIKENEVHVACCWRLDECA